MTVDGGYFSGTKLASSLEIGNYVMLKGRPCKVLRLDASKEMVVGKDLITDKKVEERLSGTTTVRVPAVTKFKCKVRMESLLSSFECLALNVAVAVGGCD